MPLIHCPACRHPVLGTAEQCPICGYPLFHHDSTDTVTIRLNITKIFLVLIYIFVIAFGIATFYLFSPEQRCIYITKQMIDVEVASGTYVTYCNDASGSVKEELVPCSVKSSNFKFDIYKINGYYEVEGTDGEWNVTQMYFNYNPAEPNVLLIQRAKEYE